ncbi:MAG TPA: orotate phosphoribosyltransferase, partial [Terriglobia bacterium]|nr:orotate phosphoribosyltransferase [Terriglobia bacterium]
MPNPHRDDLLHLLATLSFRLGSFTLASGQQSDYYIDCRTTTLHAEGARLAGLVLYSLIRSHIPHAVAVGGLTLGADPLVSATSIASAAALAELPPQAAPESSSAHTAAAGSAPPIPFLSVFTHRDVRRAHLALH